MLTFPFTPVVCVFLKPQADLLIFSVACLRLSDTCSWKGTLKIRWAADSFPVVFMTCAAWEREV